MQFFVSFPSPAAFLVCSVSRPPSFTSAAFHVHRVPHLRPDRSMLQINGVEKFYKQCSFSAEKTPHRGFNFLQKDEISQKSGCFFKSPAYENIVWTRTMYRIVPEAMEISMLRFHRKVTVTTAIATASGIPKVPPEENETFRRQ